MGKLKITPFTTHNFLVTLVFSALPSALNKGKVIASGAPEDVRANEHVVDAYLGGGV
jgi:ABC-type branched-subunit amino acid transport system ATPase component